MADVGRAHHRAEPGIVVTVLRMIVVTVGRARVVRIVVPGPATQHPRLAYGPPHRLPGDF